MTVIPTCVKADEIGPHHPFDEPVTVREGEEDLRIGKWNVEEETNARVRNSLAQQRRDAKQLIVMHPHEIPGLVMLGHRVGEARIDRLVHIPSLDVKREPVDSVVEDGPQHAVRYLFVKERDLSRIERDGDRSHRGQLPIDVGLHLRREPLGAPGPPDPKTTRSLVRAL
jgi:hypothetical protein